MKPKAENVHVMLTANQKTTSIWIGLMVAAILSLAAPAAAQTYTIAPPPFLTELDNAGAIVVSGCIWTYAAGTTTPISTYSSNAGALNTNPIVADTAGRFTAFLSSGVNYKFVYESACTSPAHGTVYRTADNIAGTPSSNATVDITCVAGESITAGLAVYVSDGSGSKTVGQCYKADSANTYSSSSGTIVVGVATAAIASAGSGNVRLVGSVTGLAALATGSAYYVGTSGALTSTAPTNSRLVGVADTATSLIVVANPNVPAAPTIDNGTNDFRLTLTTGVPVTTADVTGASAVTIFATPNGRGNRIALFSAAGVATVYSSIEMSIAVPATTSQMYDVFCFLSGSTPTLELLAWTNDTTRATALVLTTTGAYAKSGDLTRRYLGSFRTTTVSGQTEDSITKRYVWNYYNRVPRSLYRVETTASWNYTTATIRQANGATANQVDVVVGIAEVPIDLTVTGACANGGNDGTKMSMVVGIGEDSTSTFTTGNTGGSMGSAAGSGAVASLLSGVAHFLKYPAVGRHFYSWNEWSQANGTTQWYGAPASNTGPTGSANGIAGSIQG